jgi:hypothetical protein
MRLKKYLEVDIDVCLKRPLEAQNGDGAVVDKRRKLDLDMQLEVSSSSLHLF